MPATAEARRTIKDAAEEFLAQHRIAVTSIDYAARLTIDYPDRDLGRVSRRMPSS
jgi:hypothetical protein